MSNTQCQIVLVVVDLLFSRYFNASAHAHLLSAVCVCVCLIKPFQYSHWRGQSRCYCRRLTKNEIRSFCLLFKSWCVWHNYSNHMMHVNLFINWPQFHFPCKFREFSITMMEFSLYILCHFIEFLKTVSLSYQLQHLP